MLAAEFLDPRQLRAWAALAYAAALGLPVSERELGELLVHHSGKRAGEPIGAAAASAVIDSLEALGWLIVKRRAGWQGRHEYIVLDQPTPVEQSNAVEDDGVEERGSGSPVGDGSGSQAGDGSLATEEDTRTEGLEKGDGGGLSPAVGEVEVASREAPVDNSAPSNNRPPAIDGADLALRAVEQDLSPTPAADQPAAPGPQKPYAGPELTYSTRMAWMTEPVRWLLERTTVYVQRKVARELGAQLTLGIEPERLRQRLERRFARETAAEIGNPGAGC
ncbi:hypothetical protein [Streptomyces sp. RKAG337]|uniref:hypothetical protein n=1 Tax=Streptomyces sp. RKAG337 TaxID=2893404 RepID=UPI00203347F7|nr:hypothetical protein [Streptomyces sp. RKAG337]MCM2431049.1 hypothetical protein [Streptomyces sp. RKAG337]